MGNRCYKKRLPHGKLAARLAAKPCGGKFRFDSELAARMGAQAAITGRKSAGGLDLYVYRCPACERWHMTRSPQFGQLPVTATSLGTSFGAEAKPTA